MSEHMGWIRPENFAACLGLLASVGETELDDTFREAFEGGLLNSDIDSNRLYELALGKLTVAVARDDGGEVLFRVQAPHGFGRAVQVVLLASATFHLVP